MSEIQTLKRDVMDLSDQMIREIRRLYATGALTHQEIAQKFSITRYKVGRIVRGEIRDDAGGPVKRQRPRLTADQVREIRRRYASGEKNQAQLAREYGTSLTAVCRMVRGDTYQDVEGPRWRTSRRPRGQKLTMAQREYVLNSNESSNSLAKRFGVSRQAISQFRRAYIKKKEQASA